LFIYEASQGKEKPVQETTVVELSLPADIVAAIRSREAARLSDEERIKVPLAIGLYAERAVSLAKAARLAGMTRYEFALLLKKRDLPAYDYTQQDYQEDLGFAASAKE
jgi:predicted HTH domain antitoxin